MAGLFSVGAATTPEAQAVKDGETKAGEEA